MRHSRRDRTAMTSVRFNATPMVDVIFMLTIFFMLVSTFSSAENIPMDLPKPIASQARATQPPERVVLNCRLENTLDPTNSLPLYSIGPNRPESLAVISDRLAAMKEQTPNLKVIVRADRRLRYADVRAVMQIIADNNIDMLNVAAHVGNGE